MQGSIGYQTSILGILHSLVLGVVSSNENPSSSESRVGAAKNEATLDAEDSSIGHISRIVPTSAVTIPFNDLRPSMMKSDSCSDIPKRDKLAFAMIDARFADVSERRS